MKKALVILLVAFIAASGLFAAWDVERDGLPSFYNEIGDAEISTTAEGTATGADGQTAGIKVRAVQYVFNYEIPVLDWDFFIYLDDSEVEYEAETDYAYISVRDAGGKEAIFYTHNEEWGTYWNTLLQESGVIFSEMALAGGTLDVTIAIKGTTYAFTLDCSDFPEVFHEVYDPMLSDYPVVWNKFEYSDYAKDTQLVLKELYEEYEIKSTLAEYFYEYKDLFFHGEQEYLLEINMSSEDMYYTGHPYVDLELTKIGRTESLAYMDFDDSIYFEDKLVAFAFKVDNKYYLMKIDDPFNIWNLAEDGQRVFDAMKSAKTTSIVMIFNQTGTISYELDGKKFAEYYELAKEIPQI